MDFSVLMSVYGEDDPVALKAAVDSVFRQSLTPREVVLVKDGPLTSSLNDAVNGLTVQYSHLLKIVSLPNNVGLAGALNVGMKKCSQELIARMDSDDISVFNRFEKQSKCFEEDRDLSVVGGYISEFIKCADNIVGVRAVPLEDSEIKTYLKSRCPFNHMTVMFKKSDVLRAGGYLDWHYNEDYYLWIRMYKMGSKFKNLKDYLVNVRVGADMYRRRGGWKYFTSEAKLQWYMFRQNVIGFWRCTGNVFVRFIVQALMPSVLRGLVFQRFFRKQRNVTGFIN